MRRLISDILILRVLILQYKNFMSVFSQTSISLSFIYPSLFFFPFLTHTISLSHAPSLSLYLSIYLSIYLSFYLSLSSCTPHIYLLMHKFSRHHTTDYCTPRGNRVKLVSPSTPLQSFTGDSKGVTSWNRCIQWGRHSTQIDPTCAYVLFDTSKLITNFWWFFVSYNV